MLQIDSLTFVLISELTIGLLVLIIGYLIWMLGRKNRDQNAVRDFVGRLKDTEEDRLLELRERLQALTNTSEENLAMVLSEFSLQEKTLYKQIIEVFLHRSMESVMAIDARVRAITEPFCKLLAESKGTDHSVLEDLEKARQLIEDQNARMKQVRFESSQLGEQLSTALETLDEVSSEYAKMFGESKNADELEVSQKKMLNVFHQAELKARQISLAKPDKAGN